MKGILFLTLILVSTHYTSSAQEAILNKDATLNNFLFDSSLIQQRGSDNKLLFLHREDVEFAPSTLNGIRILQAGDRNTLILSDIKEDARLDIGQSGFNNSLLIEDVGVPMQIRQYGGMEIIIRGTNFLNPLQK